MQLNTHVTAQEIETHSQAGEQKRNLCCLCVCTWFSLGFPGVQEVHGVSRENEQDGDDDKEAEVLWLGCRDDHEEVQQVHQVIHRTLDSIHHPTLWFTYGLLQELSHCQVEGPQTCKTSDTLGNTSRWYNITGNTISYHSILTKFSFFSRTTWQLVWPELILPCHKKLQLFDTLRHLLTHIQRSTLCLHLLLYILFFMHVSACWLDHMTFSVFQILISNKMVLLKYFFSKK